MRTGVPTEVQLGAVMIGQQGGADVRAVPDPARAAYEKRLLDRSLRWRGQLRDGFAALNSDVDFDLRRRIQNTHVAMDSAIDGTDPGKTWAELTQWLRQRLAHELHHNHELAVRTVRAQSVDAAKFLGLDETQIVDPPAPRVPGELSVCLDALPNPPGNKISGMIMNIVLRAYLGFVMFFVFTNVTGLQLPILIGITPALLLAGIAVNEERSRQVGVRRASANQVLRSYITEFGMYAAKDSRDLLRNLELELRDGYDARIARKLNAG